MTSSPTVNALCCGWEGTLRQPLGNPPSTEARSRLSAAVRRVAGQRDERRAAASANGAASSSRPIRSKNAVSMEPARKSGWRRTRTSRSRLVTSPWIVAPCQRVGEVVGGVVRASGAQAITLASIGS